MTNKTNKLNSFINRFAHTPYYITLFVGYNWLSYTIMKDNIYLVHIKTKKRLVLGGYHFFQQIVIIGYLGGLAVGNDYGRYFSLFKQLT